MRSVLLFAICIMIAGCGSSNSTSGSPTSVPGSSSSTNASAPGGQNHVHSILIEPNNPNTLYLGGHYHLYRSTDGGAHWHALSNQMMLSMAMDPTHPATIFAVSSKRGLQRSTDGGIHWTQLTSGIPAHAIIGVAFDSAAHVVLAYGLGVYRSVDGGMHWTGALPGISISNVAASSNGTAYTAASTGLYVSRDAGLHWKSVQSVGNQPILQVAASESVAYAVSPISILKSTNNGRTWKQLPKAPAGIEFIGVSPFNPNEVFGEIGGSGFEMSHDGGATWQPANTGIRDRNFSASTIRVAPSSPRVGYTGAWGLHFYASHDGGYHWKLVSSLTH